jgi:hypothetical protein
MCEGSIGEMAACSGIVVEGPLFEGGIEDAGA